MRKEFLFSNRHEFVLQIHSYLLDYKFEDQQFATENCGMASFYDQKQKRNASNENDDFFSLINEIYEYAFTFL